MSLDRKRPPRKRPGYRWEWREGCGGLNDPGCAECPWLGSCKGEDCPYWVEVKTPKMRHNKTDADHVANVRKAWRALVRAVADARNFGLDVHTEFNVHADEPRISRHYRR